VDKHCTGWTENNHKTAQTEDRDGSTSSEWSTLYRSGGSCCCPSCRSPACSDTISNIASKSGAVAQEAFSVNQTSPGKKESQFALRYQRNTLGDSDMEYTSTSQTAHSSQSLRVSTAAKKSPQAAISGNMVTGFSKNTATSRLNIDTSEPTDWTTTASDLDANALRAAASVGDGGGDHSFDGRTLVQQASYMDAGGGATKVFNGQRMTSDFGISLATAAHLSTPLHLHPSLQRLNDARDKTIRGGNYKITQKPN